MTQPIDLLLIEDHAAEVRLLREMLRDGGLSDCRMTHVPRVEAALERLSQSSFHLIVMDLSLPDARGYEAFSRVRERASGIPIVVLSGSVDVELNRRVLADGAAAFLDKNEISGPVLAETFRSALSRR